MIYVYIFEDGSMIQTNEPPTKEDFKCIENGILEILIIEGTVYLLDANTGLVEIESK